MKKVKYLGFALLTFLFFMNKTNAIGIQGDDYSVRKILNTTDSYRFVTRDVIGTQTCTSGDNSIVTIDNDGYMTPIADGITKVTCSDSRNSIPVSVIVNINGTYTAEMTTKLNSINELSTNFVSAYGNKIIQQRGGEYPYGKEMLFFQLDELIDLENVSVDFQNATINENGINFKLSKTITIPESGVISLTTAEKTIPIRYAETLESESTAINTAMTNVKPKYYAYLNELYDDLFETGNENIQEIMIEATDLKTDLNNNNIFYVMDARYGDSSPESPMFGGIISFGINDKLYDAAEIEIHKAIKIPKVQEGIEVTEAIKDFFENNLIESDEKVEIEYMEGVSPDDEGYYQAVISQKIGGGFINTISRLLFPSLNAAESKVLSFSVVQVDEVINSNPKTNDSVNVYITMLIITLSAAYVLKVKKNNN